jgi:hypothetical protein
MATPFPAVGHRYLVDFVAFRVELFFSSPTSLTYTPLASDGTRGAPVTVTIGVEAIGDMLFLVTWQEPDKTTVVHIEDYAQNTIITNITNPDNSFEQHHGTFTVVPLSFSSDIRPLFRDAPDVAHMTPRGVRLDDPTWMRNSANAQRVYDKLAAGTMPPDGPWSPDKVALFKQWMDDGLRP